MMQIKQFELACVKLDLPIESEIRFVSPCVGGSKKPQHFNEARSRFVWEPFFK